MHTQQLPTKKLAIVLINWNSFDLTKTTLASLSHTTYTNYDCIVVDNGSVNGSGQALKLEFPKIILIESETNKGFTGGNNIGMDYGLQQDYEYIMMLNNDVEVEPNFLEPLVERLDQNPSVGAVQPLIYFHHDRNLIWNAGSRYLYWIGLPITLKYFRKDPLRKQIQQQKKIDWITGCAFMMRSNILKKTGILKERFFIYFEDVDLSFRIKKTGYTLSYVPESVIYHIAGMAQKSKTKEKEGFLSAKVHYLSSRNRIWFLKAHTPFWAIPTTFFYQFAYFVAVSFYFISRLRFNKLKAWLLGIKDGLLSSV
jgi:GT2 family glycosyltransferase